MSDVAYGQVRSEAVYVTPETPAHTLTYPGAGDRVWCRGPAKLVPALPQWITVPEAQRDPTHVVQGKITPGTFELPTYLAIPPTRGFPPPWHPLAANVFTVTVDPDGRFTYRPPGDPVATLTLTHVADNLVHWYRGCKVSAVTVSVSGTDEGTLVWRGTLGPSASAGYMTLGLNLPPGAAGDTVFLRTVHRPVCIVGPTLTDSPRLRVDDEVFEALAVDYPARTITALRGQDGSTPAAHGAGTRIRPGVPPAGPAPAATILPLVLGRLTVDGTPLRIVEMSVTHDEHLEARLTDYGTAALTGYGRSLNGRHTAAAFTAYQRAAQPQSALSMLTRIAEGVPVPLRLVAGDRATGEVAVDLPRFLPVAPESGDQDGEYTLGFEGVALASDVPGGDAFLLHVDARA